MYYLIDHKFRRTVKSKNHLSKKTIGTKGVRDEELCMHFYSAIYNIFAYHCIIVFERNKMSITYRVAVRSRVSGILMSSVSTSSKASLEYSSGYIWTNAAHIQFARPLNL